MASRNASDAQSMIDTADSALGETTNLLLRMRELAVQAANGTLSGDDRTALDAEYNQLEAEITGSTLILLGQERPFLMLCQEPFMLELETAMQIKSASLLEI